MEKHYVVSLIAFLFNMGFASLLEVPDNTRSVALGEISYLNDQLSIFANPSLQSTIKYPKVNFNLITYRDSVYGSISLGQKLTEDSGLTLGVLIANNSVLGTAFGKKFDFGNLGINLRLIQQKTSNDSNIIGVNTDFGFFAELPSTGFFLIPDKILLSLNDIGMKHYLLINSSSDFNTKLGVYYNTIKLGIDFKLSDSSPFEINAGFEDNIDIISLRAGLKFNGNFYPSGGVELHLEEDGIAYSVAALENFNLFHQISVNIDISPPKKQASALNHETEMDIKTNIKSYNNRAMEFYQNGKLREAIEEWNKVLKLEPANELAGEYIKNATTALKQKVNAYFKSSEIYLQSNQLKQAIDELEKILDLDTTNKAASEKIVSIRTQINEVYTAGTVYFDDKQYLKAIEKWQWILDRFPDYSDCTTLIEKAKEEMKNSRTQADLVNKYYEDALQEYKKGNLVNCLEKTNKILNLEPKHEKTLAFLNNLVEENFKTGLKYYGQNLFENAIAEWKKVLNIDPSNEKARFYINEAQTQLQEKITKYFIAGIDSYNSGDYLKAIENWAIALKSDPTHKEMNEYMIKALISQGILYYRQDKLNEAIEYWEKAIKLNPNEEKAGLYLKRAKNKLKMLSDLEKK